VHESQKEEWKNEHNQRKQQRINFGDSNITSAIIETIMKKQLLRLKKHTTQSFYQLDHLKHIDYEKKFLK
jgi:hypothetical protein